MNRVTSLEESLKEVRDDVKLIRENHLAHLSEDMAVIKSKMSTIEWAGKAIAGTSIASLVGSVLNLIIK